MSPEPPRDVIVIGGGITGLTAAYDLTRRGLRVIVLEASGRAGGLIQTDHVEGLTIEAGPDSVLATKPAAVELFDELGLGGEVQGVRPPGGAFVLRGRRLYRLPSPSLLGLPLTWGALARYDLLPVGARVRLALEPLIPRGHGSPNTLATDHTDLRSLATDHTDLRTDHTDLSSAHDRGPLPSARHASADDESVASFFRRRFGAATVDLIAQPLLGGIHAGDIEQLSMRSLFPRLLDLETQYGSVLKGARASTRGSQLPTPKVSPFVSLRGGMHTLVDALVSRLGDAVRLDSPVTRLEQWETGWRAHVPGGPATARAVIIAAPAFVAADLLAPIDAEAAALCARMPYVSTASIALAWPRTAIPHTLIGTGFVVARRHSDVRITACTWVSQKWEHRAPEGTALLRAFVGGAHDPDVADLEDAELIEIARRDLARVLGVMGAPAFARAYRWRRAGAQHLVGQLARMNELERRLVAHPGLFVAGSGFRSVGIPDCIADARRAATAVTEYHGIINHGKTRKNTDHDPLLF